MTCFPAVIRHQTPHRTRLEIRDLKGSAANLSRIASEMTHQLDGVKAVKMNASLGTLTVHHAAALAQDLPRIGRSRNWFDVVEGGTDASPELTFLLRKGLREMDHQLRAISANRIGTNTLFFLSMVGCGVYQIQRGKSLPAGLTLLLQSQAFVASSDTE